MLSLRGIELSRAGRIVVRDTSVEAERGDVVALLGANGAGKTTLLHYIAGILKSDSGDLYYQGGKVDPSSSKWRCRAAYVLDDGGIIPLLTVEEQICLQCVLAGVSQPEAIERTNLVVELLELNRYRDFRGDELSAGIRKRLGIAIGIVRDADLFLFDEPYGSLDMPTAAVFDRVLWTLKNRGRIVVVASHSFPCSDDLYNRVWMLSAGVAEDHWRQGELRRLLGYEIQSGGQNRPVEIGIPWIRPLV